MIDEGRLLFKKWWFYVIIAVIVIAVTLLLNGENEETKNVQNETKQTNEQPVKEEENKEESVNYKEEYKELEKNTTELVKEYQALKKENKALKEENEKLKKEMIQSKNTNDDTPVYKIGRLVDLKGKQVKVSSVETIQGSGSEKEKEGYKYLLVTVTFVNETEKEFAYNPSDFDLVTETGETIGASDATLHLNTLLEAGKLGVDSKMSGTILYEVPENSKNLKLVYIQDLYTDKKISFALN